MESPINTSFFEDVSVSSVLSTEVEMVTDKKDVEILLLQPNQRSVVTINLHWDENDDDLDKFFHGSIVTWHYYSYSDLDGWSNKSAVSDQTASRSDRRRDEYRQETSERPNQICLAGTSRKAVYCR